jgi:hypothetical protein
MVRVFYGRVWELTWDLGHITWLDQSGSLDYLTAKGGSFLKARLPLVQLAPSKWSQILPSDFQFQWTETWNGERVRKEVALLWRFAHQAVAVNV